MRSPVIILGMFPEEIPPRTPEFHWATYYMGRLHLAAIGENFRYGPATFRTTKQIGRPESLFQHAAVAWRGTLLRDTGSSSMSSDVGQLINPFCREFQMGTVTMGFDARLANRPFLASTFGYSQLELNPELQNARKSKLKMVG